MTAPERHFESADGERARVRVAVEAVGDLIAHLPNAHSGADRGLPEAWAELLKLLALGRARELRDCPRCGHVAMREATLCLHCWARLTPAPEASESHQAAGGADS